MSIIDRTVIDEREMQLYAVEDALRRFMEANPTLDAVALATAMIVRGAHLIETQLGPEAAFRALTLAGFNVDHERAGR